LIEYSIETNAKEFAEKLRRFGRDMPDFTRRLFERFGPKLGAMAAERSRGVGQPDPLHVITGRLSTSVYQQAAHDSLTIGSKVSYAAIHEYGGMAGRNRKVRIPARPYVQPSVEEFFSEGIADQITDGVFNEYKRRHGL
jgi:phage gpG-like protein